MDRFPVQSTSSHFNFVTCGVLMSVAARVRISHTSALIPHEKKKKKNHHTATVAFVPLALSKFAESTTPVQSSGLAFNRTSVSLRFAQLESQLHIDDHM